MENDKSTDNGNTAAQAKTAAKTLKRTFRIILALTVLCVAYNESFPDALAGLLGDSTTEYYTLTAMELLTVCLIPAALKMMSLKAVKDRIRRGGRKAYTRLALLRMGLVGVPLVANTVLYYCFLSVAFAYMAIIGSLCLAFVYPGEGRCQNEMQCEE